VWTASTSTSVAADQDIQVREYSVNRNVQKEQRQ
jgi:hypothetical protein